MRSLLTRIVLAVLICPLAGCSLAEAVYGLGGEAAYSGGGYDDVNREAHFDAELERWDNY